MSTPEVRLSPSKWVVAIRTGAKPLPWNTTQGMQLADEDVSHWTPLLPVSSEDGAS